MNNTNYLKVYETTSISRNKLLEIMRKINVDYFSKLDRDLIELYFLKLKELDEYLKDTSFKDNPIEEYNRISVNLLTKRQLLLSDKILEYIVTDTYANLPKIYHEIYDYIDDYGNNRDDFSYAELILLQKIITVLMYKIKH